MIFIKRKSALKPISGEIVDTENISNKKKNTYSARVIDKLTGVETIENENGIAIKYPDGRMECRHFINPTTSLAFTKAYGGVYIPSNTVVWNFPAVFKEPPHVIATAFFQGGIGGINISSKPTTTQVAAYPWYAQSYTWVAGSYGYEFIAKGFWK